VELAKSFVPVRVDGDDRDDLIKQWQIRDLPCLVFFTPDGGVLARRENDYSNTEDAVRAVQRKAADSWSKLRDARKAAQEAPEDREKLRALAVQNYSLQLWDRAAEGFERLLVLDPQDETRQRAKTEEFLVYLDLMRERTDSAVLRAESFQKARPESKALPQVLYWKGMALLRLGRTVEAVAAWEETLERAPKGDYAKLAREAIGKARR